MITIYTRDEKLLGMLFYPHSFKYQLCPSGVSCPIKFNTI